MNHSAPRLSIVGPAAKRPRKPRAKPTAESVKALQAKARRHAIELCRDLADQMDALAVQAREVAALKDAAPVGAIDVARQLGDEMQGKAANIRRFLKV